MTLIEQMNTDKCKNVFLADVRRYKAQMKADLDNRKSKIENEWNAPLAPNCLSLSKGIDVLRIRKNINAFIINMEHWIDRK